MPRPVPAPHPADLSEEDQTLFYEVWGRHTRLFGYYRPGQYWEALLNNPRLAHYVSEWGRMCRTAERRGVFSNIEREFVDVVVSVELGETFVMFGHLPDMIAVGIRPEAIQAIRRGDDGALTPGELELATFIRMVARGTVSDEVYAAMELRLGVAGTVEYSMFVCYLLMTMRAIQVFHGPVAPSEADIDARLERLLDGREPVPDISDRDW